MLLDRTTFRLPDSNIIILGYSLFSHVPQENHQAVSFGLNDFFHTSGWDVDAHNEAHRRDLAWLNSEVAALEHSDVEIVILTHWSPSTDIRAVDTRHVRSPITCAFSTYIVFVQRTLLQQPEDEDVGIWAYAFQLRFQGGS